MWPTVHKIAIDHAIAEPLAADGGIAVVPASMGWTDVGDFAAVNEILHGNRESSDGSGIVSHRSEGGAQQPVFSVDSDNCTVFTYDRPIALVGMKDVVVVDTADVVLVTSVAGAQKVKDIVDQVHAADLDHLL